MEKLTHAIIFSDKTKMLITEKNFLAYQKMRDEGGAGITINGCDYVHYSIYKVMTLQEFYQQYPAERPQLAVSQEPIYLSNEIENLPKATRQSAISGIITGLKRYIASTEDNPVSDCDGMLTWYQGTQAPLELLAKMENKLALIK